MNLKKEALKIHKANQGKLMIKAKVQVKDEHALSLAYSPGVAEPCKEITDDENKIYDYTNKANFVAVVSNGTAVLGLGNIGAKASMPVMEGKAVLFKEFGGVDAFPICIDENDPDKIVEIVKKIAVVFGGINLEDIKAPECFYIEECLKKQLDIPVFHDDQHGTAIIVLAGLINSLKCVNKRMDEVSVVVNGVGAAGVSIIKLLLAEGVGNIIAVDKQGALCEGQKEMNDEQAKLVKLINHDGLRGELKEVIKEADVFIGVSAANVLTPEMISSMADKPIIFAMANPDPEIDPELARRAGAYIIGTGRSDYPNQINNVLAFPGVFRGALDVRAKSINEEMKKAAAYALAGLVNRHELSPEYVIPKAFDQRVGPKVAAAVADAAVKSGVARLKMSYEEVLERAKKIMEK